MKKLLFIISTILLVGCVDKNVIQVNRNQDGYRSELIATINREDADDMDFYFCELDAYCVTRWYENRKTSDTKIIDLKTKKVDDYEEPNQNNEVVWYENEEYKMENESGSVNPDVTMSAAGFEDSTKDNAIYILVANYGQSNNTTEKVVKLAQTMDGKAKTINGHQGYLGEQTNDQAAAMNMTQGTVYSFVYEDNGNLVSITATNETYFNEVIPK